jgi:pimeloyl-ACP methyl ester carboxylesterase
MISSVTTAAEPTPADEALDNPDRVPILFTSGEIGQAGHGPAFLLSDRTSVAEIGETGEDVIRIGSRRAITMPHIEKKLTVNGATIRLLRGGNDTAPPLVFLHGAGGHTGWMSFLDRLAEDFTVFAPEHPGFGQSDDPPWLDEVGDLAYFYLDFLAALELRGVHLVGTSLGGWIAAELAVRNDTRLKTLTLVGAVGIPAEGKPIDDIFRMSVEENLRRFYADPERAARRLDDMAKIDAMPYAKNRSTVTRLAYNPRFYNPGLAKWLCRPSSFAATRMASFRRSLARRTGPRSPDRDLWS